MLNALLIANARSGAAAWLRDVDVPGHWILDPAQVTAEDITSADLVAFFSGDGTVQITLSQVLREVPAAALPPIAQLPFGTTNMNARDINRQQRRRAAVSSLERAIRTGRFEYLERSLLRVQTEERQEYGFFFGMGVIAEAVARWHAGRASTRATNQLRTLQAMTRALRTVGSTQDITLDGEHRSVYGLLATTLDRLLFGSRPFWGGGHAGDLRITWLESHAEQLLRRAPALLRGRPEVARYPGYGSKVVGQLALTFTGPYILDGEIFHLESQSLTIHRSEPMTWIVL